MSTMVDGAYSQGMYSSAGMVPMSVGQTAVHDPNMYANAYYDQSSSPYGGGGGYPGYSFPMGQGIPTTIDASGGSAMSMAQDGTNMQPMVIDAGMAGGSPYSFIMPAGAANGGNHPDAGLQAFQQSFGGNYSFYDTNAYGGGTMMPQGFITGYEHLPSGEPKKAVKKQPAKKETTIPKKTTKAKTLFPCC